VCLAHRLRGQALHCLNDGGDIDFGVRRFRAGVCAGVRAHTGNVRHGRPVPRRGPCIAHRTDTLTSRQMIVESRTVALLLPCHVGRGRNALDAQRGVGMERSPLGRQADMQVS
jgi:hypothetical protein